MMREKIQNTLKITCNDVDLTKISNIEFYVRQIGFFGCYVPTIISSNEMVVVIPFEDAKKLREGEVKLQFAFTDENNTPRATGIVIKSVNDLLKEVGYDPI